MTTHQEVENALRQALPANLQDQAGEIARLLVGIMQRDVQQADIKEATENNPAVSNAFASLVGKEIRTGSSTISIGQDSNLGDFNAGDIAQGNIVKLIINIQQSLPTTPQRETTQSTNEILRLRVHKAVFLHSFKECVFINAVNMRERPVEITHIWFDCNPQIPVMNHDRPLPKRLEPEETWETWMEVQNLPEDLQKNPFNSVKARLSTGVIITSQKNEGVPDWGTVPGGPITIQVTTQK